MQRTYVIISSFFACMHIEKMGHFSENENIFIKNEEKQIF